jgi:hypothetical protein
MSTKAILIGTFIAVGGLLSANLAAAKTVPISGHSAADVKAKCNGASWSSGPDTATYGCMNKDGHGIVCGGVTSQQKKTCSTFFVARSSDWPFLSGRLSARPEDQPEKPN